MDSCDLLIRNTGELLTIPDPGHAKGGPLQGELGIIKDGAVAIKGETIVEVGGTDEVKAHWRAEHIIDATGMTVMPGFVDCHTHLPFAGSREHELQWKLEGRSYSQILAEGGGILSTVKLTRAASQAELEAQARRRLDTMLAHGTTTAEAKSGYGLETETELKQLRVVKALNEDPDQPVELVPTFLGAHAFPPEMEPEVYIELVVNEMLPRVAKEGLARYCDVFCEEGVYTVEQARRVMEAGRRQGLVPRLHADELADSGGSGLAAELGAASADHLEFTTPASMRAMKEAGTIGVLLPGTPLTLFSNHYPAARTMIQEGLPLALATDLNPNCYCESMLSAIQLGVFRMRLTPAEAIVASTLNPAHSLGLPDRGSLVEGKRADVLLMDAPNHLHLAYHFGVNLVKTVVAGGRVVADGQDRYVKTRQEE